MILKRLILPVALFAVFTARAQTPERLRSFLPVLQGWDLDEKTEVFSPENLFDRINGSAPLFIENNFREMTSFEYTLGDDYITVQAYRHATPEDAFGMYASERAPDLEYLPFAAEAQGDGAGICFVSGDIYVKMWSNTDGYGPVLREIGETLASRIDPSASLPAVFSAFPERMKVAHSEVYITSNYNGHEFLKGVYAVNYETGNGRFESFVLAAETPEEAGAILNRYAMFARMDLPTGEGFYEIADRYNGDIPMLWSGRYLLGIVANGRMPDAERFLRMVADALP